MARAADLADGRQIDAFDARQVESVLVRRAATLVMRVDAADAAEPVLGDLRVPLVQAELVLATRDAQPVHGDARHDGAPATAHGAVATAYVLVAVDQVNLELYGHAMAGSLDGLLSDHRCALFVGWPAGPP